MTIDRRRSLENEPVSLASNPKLDAWSNGQVAHAALTVALSASMTKILFVPLPVTALAGWRRCRPPAVLHLGLQLCTRWRLMPRT